MQITRDRGFGTRFVVAVSAGSVLNPINSSIIAIALVSVGRTFGVGTDTTAWLVSALYLATAIGQPAMGRLADRLGARSVYLAGLALVAAGGLLGTWGPSFGALVVARMVLGLGTSAAYPAGMAMVRAQSLRLGRETPGSVLGALAIAGQATMAVGPPLGGLLITLGGWRATFAINIPLAVAGAIFALLWLPRDTRPAAGGSLDPVGIVLFAGTLGTFMIIAMTSHWWLLAVAVVLLAALVGWELRVPAPFVDVRMLAHNRGLTATYLRYAVTMLVTYCFIYGWTLWLEQSAGRSAGAAGLLMMPSFVVAALVSGFAARRGRVRGPLILGIAVMLAGDLCLLTLRASTPTWALAGVSIVFGVQNGLNVVTNQAAMYAQAPAGETGTAAGLLRTFMYLGAIVSAGLIGMAYGGRATDAGLHHLALLLTIVSAALLATSVVDPSTR